MRSFCCLTPSAPRPAGAAGAADGGTASQHGAAPSAAAVDRFEGPARAPHPGATAEAPPPREAANAATRAVGNIIDTDLSDPGLPDIRRAMLVQEAMDALVPWMVAARGAPRAMAAWLGQFDSVKVPPDSAGMLATVCCAACIAAMRRPGGLAGGRGRAANAALFNAVSAHVKDWPAMAAHREALKVAIDAAHTCLDSGKDAMHGAMFESYVAQLGSTSPPPAAQDIPFFRHALLVLGAVNVDSAYRIRKAEPLHMPSAPNPSGHLGKEATRRVQSVHEQLDDFIRFGGGLGLASRLRWALEQALTLAADEPQILERMFEPRRWRLRAVRAPARKHPRGESLNPKLDMQAHLQGALYFAVLNVIAGTPKQGWFGRITRVPLAVARNSAFLVHVFTALHRGVMKMPAGWIPPTQLGELHRVALDGVAQDCDAYTMRTRIQAYAAAAAASPGLEKLDAHEASMIAASWEAFRSRLFTDECPLDEPA